MLKNPFTFLICFMLLTKFTICVIADDKKTIVGDWKIQLTPTEKNTLEDTDKPYEDKGHNTKCCQFFPISTARNTTYVGEGNLTQRYDKGHEGNGFQCSKKRKDKDRPDNLTPPDWRGLPSGSARIPGPPL